MIALLHLLISSNLACHEYLQHLLLFEVSRNNDDSLYNTIHMNITNVITHIYHLLQLQTFYLSVGIIKIGGWFYEVHHW